MNTLTTTLKHILLCAPRYSAWVAGSLLVSGCTVLPNSNTASTLPWQSYTDAKSAFEQVQVGNTTTQQLHHLGFAPTVVPNTRQLNYVDVVNAFGASFRLQDLPSGVRQCVQARDGCQAYLVRGQNIQNQREGNIAADLFGFKKRTRTSGWEFAATIVLVDNVVTYKLWSGTPHVESTTKESNPLGPMQSLSGLVPKPSF